MKIDIGNGQFYYDLFYQISFLLVLIVYLAEGYRRKFPWSTWLLVIITVRIFFIIGSKFGAITPQDFSYFAEHLQFPAQHYKNLMGALFFGFVGVGFAKVLLRIKYPILDAFAIAAPLGMAVQRIGCLMVGCCYGTETTLPWNIQYGQYTPAYLHQMVSHHITSTDALTHGIHPIPLYFIVSCLAIAVALILLRNYWKRPGNLALFSLLLVLASRFVIEFFRDPQSNGSFQGNYFLGLKIVQIFSLISVFALMVVIYFREKQPVNKTVAIEPNHPLLNSSYLLMVSVLLYVTRNWFTTVEFQVLLIILIPAALSVIRDLIASYFTRIVRISSISLMLFSVLIMSQSNPQTKSTSYQAVKLGYSGGEFTNFHDIGYGDGCDRQSLYQHFDQSYNLGGVGYSVAKKDSLKLVEYGLNGYVGTKWETGLTTGIHNTNAIWGLNPYISADYKWFGVGAGLHLGDIRITPAFWNEDNAAVVPQTGSMHTYIYPHLYGRVGIERIAYVSYHLGDHFPSPFPVFYHYLELGSGFGTKNGFKASVGVTSGGSYLVRAKIPIAKTFILEPVYQWGSADYYLSSNKNYQFSLGVSYLFGYRYE